jgi:D-lactate dehydrogenase (cytochrome)
MIIKKDQDEIQKYLTDESSYIGFCDAVYFPETENEVKQILEECNLTKTKITVSGNGTGLTSGRVPEGGIVVSLEKLNKILEINEAEKYIVVEPAVILRELQNFVEEKNLFYPPDPTERDCFIGATVVTNSSGARTFKYGPTRDYVLGLKIILTDGSIVELERDQFRCNGYDASLKTEEGKTYSFQIPKYEMPDTKNAAGYYCKENMDLIDLFIGSEGTLGIVTKLKLKLINLPKDLLSCVAFFPSEDDALDFIAEAREKSKAEESKTLSARGLEYFDNFSLRFMSQDYPNIPELAKAAVWFEQELNDNEDEMLGEWVELITKHSGFEEESWLAVDKKEQEKFKDFRHAIAWKVNEFISKHGLKKVGTDVAVPHNVFCQYYYYVKKKIEGRNIKYVVYGHIGNSHMHLNMLPTNQDEYKTARELYKEICLEAIKLKGTFSAEHGVGKSKRDFLVMMYGENTIMKMATLKLVFDPNKILNIGNIFEEKYL